MTNFSAACDKHTKSQCWHSTCQMHVLTVCFVSSYCSFDDDPYSDLPGTTPDPLTTRFPGQRYVQVSSIGICFND